MAKTFKGSYTLAPGTIFSGYTEGTVENRDGRIVIAAEPGGKNKLEGDAQSMLSLGAAISEACGIEFTRTDAGPAPSVVGVIAQGDRLDVHFNNGTFVTLRKPQPVKYDFIPA